MSKILSALAILCLVSVAWCTDSVTSQTIASSALYSPEVQVLYGTNATDWAAAVTGASPVAATKWYTVTNGNNANVMFGPGTNNGTIYAYGLIYSSTSTSITGVVIRALNATLILNGTVATEPYTKSDTSVTVTIPLASQSTYSAAVGPGYLAILSTGVSTNNLVQVTVIAATATTATPMTVSANAAGQTYTLGNIWYDIGSGAFFYTYLLTITASSTTAVYLGGVVASTNTLYWANPGLVVLAAQAHTLNYLFSGPNNWLNSTSILVTYKDTTAAPGVTYYSVTTKSTNTSTAGTPAALVTDVTSGTAKNYFAIGVWASNATYGIACALTTTPSGGTAAYSIENFLNGTTTNMSDSGIYNSTTTAATGLWGWQLNTGYTLAALSAGSTDAAGLSTTTYALGSFYANGTANGTSTLGSLAGPLNVFEDVNGTMWVGWTDIDATQSNVYNLWVARLQGQLNIASSSANAIKTIMAFVAFCLVAVFAF